MRLGCDGVGECGHSLMKGVCQPFHWLKGRGLDSPRTRVFHYCAYKSVNFNPMEQVIIGTMQRRYDNITCTNAYITSLIA